MSSDSSESNKHRKKKKTIFSGLIKKLATKKKGKPDSFDIEQYQSLDRNRKDMVRGVVKLSRLDARDIMIPRVDIFAVDSDTDYKSLLKLVCDAGHSRVPVYEERIDLIIGILYVKDLIRLTISRPKKFSLKKIMHEPYFVPETMPLDELLLEFKLRKLHMAVVVDEYGGLGGIVTMEDILEEIVGDINDEFDEDSAPDFEKKGRNVFEVDSRMSISDFNENTGLLLEADDFDTIGGFVLDLFGKIPAKDEEVLSGNITFKIKEIVGTRIDRIVVSVSRHKQ